MGPCFDEFMNGVTTFMEPHEPLIFAHDLCDTLIVVRKDTFASERIGGHAFDGNIYLFLYGIGSGCQAVAVLGVHT